MTQRRYYQDAYKKSFEANIVERFDYDGCLGLVLDITYFYPTSGGQPADRGWINGMPVVDVFVRQEDSAVVHIVEGEVWSDEIQGELNWTRRFDHMQQHSGQHILSQAFIRRANAHTVGFHLSENSVTIDLQPSKLTPEDIEAAETLANRIVWEDRPITARLMSLQQAKDMELRKLPDVEGELVRLIDIDDFDLTACGGTHVSRTGAVGIIKILKLEQRGEQLRVEFNCGQRALVDYRQKNFILTRLASELTTGYWEVEQSVAKLRDELKQAQRDTRQQRQEVMALLAQQLLHDANEANGLRLVVRAFDDKEPDDLKSLAAKLVEHENVVALLGLSGEKTRLLFACSDQVPGVMNELLKSALQVIGSSGGGGSPRYAQGGGPAASLARVQQALTRAERLLLAQVR